MAKRRLLQHAVLLALVLATRVPLLGNFAGEPDSSRYVTGLYLWAKRRPCQSAGLRAIHVRRLLLAGSATCSSHAQPGRELFADAEHPEPVCKPAAGCKPLMSLSRSVIGRYRRASFGGAARHLAGRLVDWESSRIHRLFPERWLWVRSMPSSAARWPENRPDGWR